MVNNFYTLHALVREWATDLTGCLVGDAFSQVRGELTLALVSPEHAWMLRVSTQAPFYFIFRTEGFSKARRNVATLFEPAFDQCVETIRIAERDRMIVLELEGGRAFQIMLFGPRANVFLVDKDGIIIEAFQDGAALEGTQAPTPRPAPRVEAFDDFAGRWRTNRRTTEQAVASALPLFDRTLAAEVLHRAGVANKPPEETTDAERRVLFEVADVLRDELIDPAPHIYWKGRFADTFALVRLHHLTGLEEESFETVDAAVQVFVRRTLGQRRFRAAYEPLEKALANAEEDARRRFERMMEELENESRAERYERWGHLLMAAAADVPRHADEVTLPDLFEGGEDVTIPLDPARTPVENAERYYDKARHTRQARAHAEERALDLAEEAEQAGALLARLHTIDRYKELERFKKDEAEALAAFVSEQAGGQERVPFRRFDLGRGYEVWVGRNARQNDDLTFHYAQKYDLWMHARGVPGSHAVLRLPNRDAEPDRRLIRQAAAIAAHFSKAQGSSLVPVMVAPRKYVRKPKGGAPGAVFVEHEDVVLVEPGLP